MQVSAQDLFSRGDRSTRLKRVVQFSLIRWGIFLIALTPAIIALNLVYGRLIDAESRWTSWTGDFAAVLIVALTIYSYRFSVNLVEKRPAFEVQRRGSGIETGVGFAVGTALVFLCWLVILIFGSFELVSANPGSVLIHGFFIFGLLAFFEELVFRAILLRLFEELMGTGFAIVVVAIGFGAVHLVHDEATGLSSTAIALSDLVLSGAFVLTRKVWLSWGIHWGWNFAQDGLLGMPNSSVDYLPSLLNSDVTGSTWLTGGVFGIELSVVSVALNLCAGLLLIRWAINRGQIVKPIWKRSTRPGTGDSISEP